MHLGTKGRSQGDLVGNPLAHLFSNIAGSNGSAGQGAASEADKPVGSQTPPPIALYALLPMKMCTPCLVTVTKRLRKH